MLYEFVPWHRMSSVTIQTRDDAPDDIGAWKYYFSAESDGPLIRDEYEAWHNESDSKRLVYYRLLIEAAEAFLSIDFGKYGNPYWTTVNDNFCLNKTFLLQVHNVDRRRSGHGLNATRSSAAVGAKSIPAASRGLRGRTWRCGPDYVIHCPVLTDPSLS